MSTESNAHKMSQSALTVAALGIVFGDIGTSPLYAVREAFHGPHSILPTNVNIFGTLSLIVWSLIVVISVKYLLFILKADNKGEGGVLALTALAAPPKYSSSSKWGKILLYLGLFGSSLLFGDGVITPAISVLSAVEGLKIATPLFEPFVVPITIGILGVLFSVQKFGTAKIGSIFGPIIFIWFIVLGITGVNGILIHPEILGALNPKHVLNFFSQNGFDGLIVLGAVFLVVTGGEALYADMGHLGIKPIQRAWFFVALPGLLLNYFGQGALILSDSSTIENPFYLLAPNGSVYFLVFISTLATVIASQALISGVFSLTRQAVQLGYFPRLKIIHTSSLEIGQIYIPVINGTLFLLTAWLVITFGTSSALASAYGIAVSTTMVITTILACTVAVRNWKWKWFSVLIVIFIFLTIDLIFFSANFTKIADGGWFPLLMGSIVFTLMTTWREGRRILANKLNEKTIPIDEFLEGLNNKNIQRIEGTAVFMSGSSEGTPLALVQNVRHNKCLHTKNAMLSIVSVDTPYVSNEDRIIFKTKGEDFYRIIAKYGFMESPDIIHILSECKKFGATFNLPETTFYLGRETILPTARYEGMSLWREHLFSFMLRNAERATAYFNIPPDQVVEVGILVEI
jgi:KUP system potassium uptake protein